MSDCRFLAGEPCGCRRCAATLLEREADSMDQLATTPDMFQPNRPNLLRRAAVDLRKIAGRLKAGAAS